MKKSLTGLLALLMVLHCLYIGVTAASPAVWDGSIAASYAGGDGSEASPYQIETPAQLAYFAAQINAGQDLDAHVVLTADMDLGGTHKQLTVDGVTYFAGIEATPTWTPIGSADHPFGGTFDGANHKISSIVTRAVDGQYQIGLFGVISGATIRNVCIESGLFTNVSVETAESETVRTNDAGVTDIGSIAAQVAKGSEGNRITRCYNKAGIYVYKTDKAVELGGMVGVFPNSGGEGDLTLQYCANLGEIAAHVVGQSTRIGGLLGYTTTVGRVTIADSYNSGSVTVYACPDTANTRVGGLAGSFHPVEGGLLRCWSTGEVNLPESVTKGRVGTLVGSTKNLPDTVLYAAEPDGAVGYGEAAVSPMIAMQKGASIRLVADSHGIRFVSQVPAGVLDMVEQIKDADSEISFGTVILPTEALNGALTLEALQAAGMEENTNYIVIRATQKGVHTDGEGNRSVYAAMVEEPGKVYDAAMAFSAAAYLEFTSAGVIHRIYTAYDAQEHSRSMRQVALAALADEDMIWSPEQTEILNGYAVASGNQ